MTLQSVFLSGDGVDSGQPRSAGGRHGGRRDSHKTSTQMKREMGGTKAMTLNDR